MKQKIFNYISIWEKRGYETGIPDEADQKLESMGLVPSYRLICKAILKNDLALTSLGFQREKTKSYNLLKKIELSARGK